MLFGKKGGKKQCVAIDIGTSGARAVLFSCPSDNVHARPKVLDILSIPYRNAVTVDAAFLHESALQSVDQIVLTFGEHGGVEDFLIGFSTPFYISRTARISLNRPQPRLPLRRTEVHALQRRGKEEFIQSLQGRMHGEDIYVFTETLLKTFVNGYRIAELEGVEGKVVEIVARYEATTWHIMNNFESVVTRHVPRARVHFTSFPIAFFYVLGATQNAGRGFLVADIGAEITELSFIRQGVLERVVVVPIGVHALVRRAAEAFSSSWDDAQFLVRRRGEGILGEIPKKKMEHIEGELRHDWQEAIRSRLADVAGDAMPFHIILVGGGGMVPLFRDAFTAEFLQQMMVREHPLVEVAGPHMIASEFERQQFFGPADFGLACLALLSARGVV